MKRPEDLAGRQFERLTVIELRGRGKQRGARWLCRCRCGTVRIVAAHDLKSGATLSCGCLGRERRRKHGLHRTPEYRIWASMLDRCRNPNGKYYHHYGGRGITVCERWYSFRNFIADMGQRPSPKHTIERRDNERGYSKRNCRWATKSEQMNNTRQTRLLTFRGKTQCLVWWAREIGIDHRTLNHRIQYGWSVERALTEPVHAKREGKHVA